MLPISPRFEQALMLALELHRDQPRKGSSVPYVAHLLSVAALTMEHGGSEDEAIAALLHDAVEDQGGQPTLDRIRELFGVEVAQIVESCTDAYGEPKPAWHQRKQQHMAHLEQASASALLVAGCDKLHNARSILAEVVSEGECVFERFKGGKSGTLWYYRTVTQLLKRTGPARVAQELERVVCEIERHAGSVGE